MKKLLSNTGATILLLLLIVKLGYGQDFNKSKLTFKDQIRFSLSPVLYDNLSITHWGEKLLKSRPVFSGEATILYHKHLKNDIGVNFGVGLGLAPYNINYYFKAPENSIFQTGKYKESYEYLDNNHYDYVQFMWVFPLSIQKLIEREENKYYSIEAGIKLNRVVAYPYEITTGHLFVIDDTTEARLFDFKLDGTKKNLVSYFLKAGLIKVTKNQNTIQLNAVLHYSFSKIGIGYYEFQNLPYESRGQVSQNINYIGLEFIYGLSLSKRSKNNYSE